MAKLLSELLSATPIADLVQAEYNREIHDITHNSRNCTEKSCFVALRGSTTDGHAFINQAIDNGAECIVCEILPEIFHPNISYVVVENARTAAADLSHAFFDFPSEKLRIVGVTGTNGKTSITFMLRELLQSAGINAGIIGTTGNYVNDEIIPTNYTTPEAPELCFLLNSMAAKGVKTVVMEVSSHALAMQRVRGIRFSAGIFVNLTHDHLDFHGTMEDYAAAKKMLFNMLPASAVAVVNADDAWAEYMVSETSATPIRVGSEDACAVVVRNVQTDIHATNFSMTVGGKCSPVQTLNVKTPFSGLFQAENAALCLALALYWEIDSKTLLKTAEKMRGAPGRMEKYFRSDGALVIVDYAHTPDAMLKLLESCTVLKKSKYGKLIVIFGCGGNRDKHKRKKMGEIAAHLSDAMIVCNDNPRSEPPEDIVNDILSGIDCDVKQNKVFVEYDRKKAILQGLDMLGSNDIAVVAGKGHERSQTIGNQMFEFDDREIVKNYIEKQQKQPNY